VHESGVPFDDASGDRLREWMGIDRDTFYDVGQIAIPPMGFCYPGTGSNGALPPRAECAPLWRAAALLASLKRLELTLLIKNPWFVAEVVPALRTRVAALLQPHVSL